MNAEAAIPVESSRPRWRRRLSRHAAARAAGCRSVEIGDRRSPCSRWSPSSAILIVTRDRPAGSAADAARLVAALLVANLVPAMALMVLVARRLAIRRAVALGRSAARARLHVRLVALFSIIAAVPTLLVVIFASMLFQSGVEFWFSDQAADRAEQRRERRADLRRASIATGCRLDVQAMGGDVVDRINRYRQRQPGLPRRFPLPDRRPPAHRDRGPARSTRTGRYAAQIEVNFDDRPLDRAVHARRCCARCAPARCGSILGRDRVEAVVRLDPQAAIYFYGVARRRTPTRSPSIRQAQSAASDYQSTLESTAQPPDPLQRRPAPRLAAARSALAIWIALKLADRLVRPVGQLVDAARRVTAGDLSARVPPSRTERRGRHARQCLQPDDRPARGADRRAGHRQRPARQPPRLHRGGAVGRDRGRHLGRRRPCRAADQQLGRGAAQDRRQEPGRPEARRPRARARPPADQRGARGRRPARLARRAADAGGQDGAR